MLAFRIDQSTGCLSEKDQEGKTVFTSWRHNIIIYLCRVFLLGGSNRFNDQTEILGC